MFHHKTKYNTVNKDPKIERKKEKKSKRGTKRVKKELNG